MALNNLERLASQGERAAFLRLVTAHPGAIPLLARLDGTSQFLADTLRRYPTLLPWLLEARTMRQWLADELAADLAASLVAFDRPEARWNALRRFKYRQLLRIGCRDILGDADLTVTTEELSYLADACLAAAWEWTRERLVRLHGEPIGADGAPTGLAVIGMGKLGGLELNYSSDIDPIFVYGEDGETAGGESGRIANGEFFAQAVRGILETLESVTEEGHVFRVDLRLRPEGRSGALILSVDGYRRYFADRAELWERQALIKARACAGDPAVAARFFEAVRPFVYRPGLDPAIVGHVRGMKAQIDRSLRGKDASRRNVKLGRGGIREVEFLVQALQLLYGGDDPWLRERNSLRAIFRLTERGYLPPALGRELGRRARLSPDRRAPPPDRARVPDAHPAGGAGGPGPPGPSHGRGAAARGGGPPLPRPSIGASPRWCTGPSASSSRRRPRPPRRRCASRATPRSRPPASPIRTARVRTSGCVLEGRPLIPYPAAAGRAIARLFPVLLDALWQSPDPDEALGQFERFVSAAGPRTAYLDLLADRPELLTNLVRLCARGELLTELLIEPAGAAQRAREPGDLRGPQGRARLPGASWPRCSRRGSSPAERRDRLRRLKQAQELGIIWRMLLGVTDAERFSLEMTALGEAALAVAWTLALEETVAQSRCPARPARAAWSPPPSSASASSAAASSPPAPISISSSSTAATARPTGRSRSRPTSSTTGRWRR